MNGPERSRRFRGRVLALPALAVVAATASVGRAEGAAESPSGIVVGPWILTPSYSTEAEADSNIFNNDIFSQTKDRSVRHGLQVGALLPFSNSKLELGYEAQRVDYAHNSLFNDLVQQMNARLVLNLTTGDQLTVRESLRRDFVQIDPTLNDIDAPGSAPEAAFFGVPYHDNRIDVTFERSDPRRRGFAVRIGRRDFVYHGQTTSAEYDYRGYDSSFEYRQPVSPRKGIILYYGRRRLNHYDPNGVVGEVTRRESADDFALGLRGQFGRNRPFLVRVGYGGFRYELNGATTDHSLTGFVRWRVAAGARSWADLLGSRDQLASTFSSHYIDERLRTTAGYEFSGSASAYVSLGAGQRRYAPVQNAAGNSSCELHRRHAFYDVGLGASWNPFRLLRLEAGARHEAQNSNCEGEGFGSQTVRLGLTVGWF